MEESSGRSALQGQFFLEGEVAHLKCIVPLLLKTGRGYELR